jgi:hypothetical protein
VRKAIETGRIAVEADGTIDPDAADRQWEANTDTTRNRGGTAGKGSRGTRRKVSSEAMASVEATLAEEGLEPEGSVTLTDAKTAHEIVKTHLARIRLAKMRGELVDSRRATDLIFAKARAERDVWLQWPARVAAIMASELGVDPHLMETVLDAHVRQYLADIPGFKLELR